MYDPPRQSGQGLFHLGHVALHSFTVLHAFMLGVLHVAPIIGVPHVGGFFHVRIASRIGAR
jgi:hypothetical protein